MRKERRHGRSEGKRGGRMRAEEGGSNGAKEENGRSMGGREIGREGNFKGGTLRRTQGSIQYTAVSAPNNTNVALAIATLVLRVYKLCIVMRRNVLFDRWMT